MSDAPEGSRHRTGDRAKARETRRSDGEKGRGEWPREGSTARGEARVDGTTNRESAAKKSPNETDSNQKSLEVATEKSADANRQLGDDHLSGNASSSSSDSELAPSLNDRETSESVQSLALDLLEKVRISDRVPPDLGRLAARLASDHCRNVVVLTGAGVSVACGIPDFRSPGTGLYANLAKYNLPVPEAIFDLHFFQLNPLPFFDLVKSLHLSTRTPSTCHYFLRLLQDKRLLRRNYTQNIDALECQAGVDLDNVIFAHGSFASNTCLTCHRIYTLHWAKTRLLQHSLLRCDDCSGLVKPDVTFFGEPLPSRFFQLQDDDLANADLLIVIGTSLQVYPFADLVSKVSRSCPRALINNVLVGDFERCASSNRDMLVLGDCQQSISLLINLLGWQDDLAMLKRHAPTP